MKQIRCLKNCGYIKTLDTEDEIIYTNEYDIEIVFNLLGNSFCKTSEDEFHYFAEDIDMQELQAINTKVKELGWIK